MKYNFTVFLMFVSLLVFGNERTYNFSEVACSIDNVSVTTECVNGDAVLTVIYKSLETSAQEASVDGVNFQDITSGGQIIISGPTAFEKNRRLVIRDKVDNNCQATFGFDIPECVNVCHDFNNGDVFDIVSPTVNSNGAEWSERSGTYTVNAACGAGCTEETDSWMVYGPIDLSSNNDYKLVFDALRELRDGTLNVQYSNSYSGCPSKSSWVSVGTLTDSGRNVSFDFSNVSGTEVYIGIQYQDADGSYAQWTLSNLSLETSEANCPTKGIAVVSECIDCTISNVVAVAECNGNNAEITVTYDVVESSAQEVSIDGVTYQDITNGGIITVEGPVAPEDIIVTVRSKTDRSCFKNARLALPYCAVKSIVINEVHPKPIGSGEEFVELYNTSTSAVDLYQWTLSTSNGVVHNLPKQVLQPGEFFVIYESDASSGSLDLDDNGQTIYLNQGFTARVAGDAVADEYTYPVAEDGVSYARLPDGTGDFGVTSNVTPAEANKQGQTFPVDYLTFDAVTDSYGVVLHWATATEINNDVFEVERSFDGFTFETIGEVSGAGNADTVNNYTFSDANLLSAYYRLKQIDFDGKYEYSKSVFVKGQTNTVAVYPNPVKEKEELNIRLGGNNSFIVFNLLGEEIDRVEDVKVDVYKLPTSRYNSGYYVIRFNDGSAVKFYKQ